MEEKQLKNKLVKDIFLFSHYIKFLLIPGYHLDKTHSIELDYRTSNYKKRFNHRIRSPTFIIGIGIVLFLITLAIFPHWISPYTYKEITGYYYGAFSPPSIEHLFGTTRWGRDILSRLIFGSRASLIFIGISNGLGFIFGIFIGAIAGYYGGWLDTIIMRIMNIIQSFPGVIFAITVLFIYGGSFLNVIIVFSIISIPYFATAIRTSVLKQKENLYIASAKIAGAGNFRIIFRHILPNSIKYIIVVFSFNCCRILLDLTVIAFFRITDPSWIDWGNEIYVALDHIYDAPSAIIFPSLMVVISILGFLLTGDALRDAFAIKDDTF